jgi:hypothetical protein
VLKKTNRQTDQLSLQGWPPSSTALPVRITGPGNYSTAKYIRRNVPIQNRTCESRSTVCILSPSCPVGEPGGVLLPGLLIEKENAYLGSFSADPEDIKS